MSKLRFFGFAWYCVNVNLIIWCGPAISMVYSSHLLVQLWSLLYMFLTWNVSLFQYCTYLSQNFLRCIIQLTATKFDLCACFSFFRLFYYMFNICSDIICSLWCSNIFVVQVLYLDINTIICSEQYSLIQVFHICPVVLVWCHLPEPYIIANLLILTLNCNWLDSQRS